MKLLTRSASDVVFSIDLRWPAPAPAAASTCARPGRVVVVITGDLDIAGEPMMVEAVTVALAERQPANLEVDLSGVRFIDARGVGALITCARTAAEVGAGCRIVRASRPVYDVMRIVELDNLLPPPRRRGLHRRARAG